MCGIFGYIGNKNNAASLVLEGLKLLEYRGYDSWGVAVKVDQTINVDKHIGKIGNAQVDLPPSSFGIGHTRWATHGGVTDGNAHPHIDCHKEIAVIHNGIIENFQDLKDELIQKGHIFISETDTEVLPHLIEENLKSASFEHSVRQAFNSLKGMNAVVVAYAPSSEIIAAKTGSPLVIGIGENELFVASDASAIVGHTKNVIFLQDHEMAILNKNVRIIDLTTGSEKNLTIEKLSWEFEDSQKGEFEHFLLKEIYEEPLVIENIALTKGETTRELAALIDKAFGTFMFACGSASYAGIAATYMFSKIAKKHINFVIGSEYKYFEDFITSKTLLIPISQSGESIDVIEPVMKMKEEKGVVIASIVNTLGSTLYRASDFRAMLECGQEKSVAATKSFIAMLSMILLTAYTVAGDQGKGQALLRDAAKDIKSILEADSIARIKEVAQALKAKQHIYIIGRGVSFAGALEATLKIKEAACIHAEAFPGGELKHGVMALIEKGTPCIVFAPNDETYDEIISNAQEVKARGGYIVGIGPKNNKVFDSHLLTADNGDATLLSQVAQSHLLAYYLAIACGIEDVDKPRNLAKSVTVK